MKKLIITGHVGKEPEIRLDQSGNEFATFSLAVSVGTKQAPKVDWVDVSCNGKLAELTKNYVKKGSKLLIEGFPGVNAYANKDNQIIGSLRVYANIIEFMSKREDEELPDFSAQNQITGNGMQLNNEELNSMPF